MEYEDIKETYLNRLSSVPDTLLGKIDKQNQVLWKELLKLLESLEVKDGVILNTPLNIAKSNEIVIKLKQVMFGGDYIEGVKEYISAFDTQVALSKSLYALEFDNFSDKSLYNSVLDLSKRTTLQLFDVSAIDKAWAEPLKKIMDDNIILKGSYNDMIGVLKDYVLGTPDIDAKLTRYVGLYARDSFNIFNSTYAHVIADDLGAEFFEYCCGLVKDSRDFCKKRVGKIYSKKEIESWASQDWQGKNPNTTSTTIFEYRGGFNCMHTFLARGKKSAKNPELNTFNNIDN